MDGLCAVAVAPLFVACTHHAPQHAHSHPQAVGYYGGAPMLEEGGLQMLHAAYGAQGSVAGTAGLGFNASVQVKPSRFSVVVVWEDW